ncbi:DUF190 domain-containing protein [Dyella sp. C11]|uniref:DUF190 domain-containing protein n=1 Tax=Dyella sp. C11 TaxID=2126991 RepID=UPI000D6473E9|nr:DUF190 domain-containing protein [Dyella sp. C11]
MNDTTKKLTALRLYFHHAATVEPSTFWHRLSKPTVASHLLKNAHREGIEQVLVHQVHSGYLAGDKPQLRHVEHVHPRLPHCIELVDIEHKLRDFWANHCAHLDNVRALFMPCEAAESASG